MRQVRGSEGLGFSRTDERGASAVEMALVGVFILFPLTFGMIQYGLYFNDSLNARLGAREAARQGVVKTIRTCDDNTMNASDALKLKCMTIDEVGALTSGTPYVATKADTWAKGSPLTVCVLMKQTIGFGLIPLPDDGWIFSKAQLSIEQATPALTGMTRSDPLPSGSGVSWPAECV